MPVCVNCAYPAEHLYTTYTTKSNIRLGVCPRCHSFLDPLIEHPLLLLLLDLILLKPRVFLHLLFNRHSPPRDAAHPERSLHDPQARVIRVRHSVTTMFGLAVAAETAVRVLARRADGSSMTMKGVMVVALEMVAQLGTTTLLVLGLLRLRGWYPSTAKQNERRTSKESRDGRRDDFLPLLIPLTLLYTSLLPLVLHLLLSIWYQPPLSSLPAAPINPHSYLASLLGSINLPATVFHTVRELELELKRLWFASDLVWVGTRLLGGMSSGFGLRVLLPTKPWETTGAVLAGWTAGAVVGSQLGLAH